MKEYYYVDSVRRDKEGDCLRGPNDFVCFLGEPEDCNWYRGGSDVVKELNKLRNLIGHIPLGDSCYEDGHRCEHLSRCDCTLFNCTGVNRCAACIDTFGQEDTGDNEDD